MGNRIERTMVILRVFLGLGLIISTFIIATVYIYKCNKNIEPKSNIIYGPILKETK
jgi:uncharacterized membrane protein (DUF485 family)